MHSKKINETQKLSVLLRILGNKWTVDIMQKLLSRPYRFGELEKSLRGISSRTLSIRLNQLEKHGVIIKNKLKNSPQYYEYLLSKSGQKFNGILDEIKNWTILLNV